MAASTVIKNSFGSGSITLQDGTGSPLEVVVDFDQGDLSLSGMKAALKDTAAYQTRGTLRSVRHTSRTFPTISFSAMMSEFTDASGGTAIDMIMGKTGTPFAARVSTLGANADVMAFKVKIQIEGTDNGDSQDHEIQFDDVELSFDWSEGDPSTFSFSGTVWGAITGDIAVS